MCGIAGFISVTDDARKYRDVYASMLNALKNRGPDDNGIYLESSACLLHSRLAVVDIKNGRQPMIATRGDTKTVLVYNGELYNTEDLRRELLTLGYSFNGHCDTEVVLKSYLEWGEKCVNKFNGIYAFAVWDCSSHSLFIARDRMGVKPFFYSMIGNRFIFASEIKALLCHPLVKPEIDETGVAEVLLTGPGRTPGYGVFRQVNELEPGFCGTLKDGILHTYAYWKFEAKPHFQDFNTTLEVTRSLVSDAIKRQTVSDVPLCSFLSGGLDSSIIAALSGVQHTFSVDYAENDKYFKADHFQPDSDNHYIDLMTRYLGIKHTTVTLESSDLVSALFDAVDARDLPGMADVDSSLLLFCKKVRKHATVALSGECADELFGGYPWFRDEGIREQAGFPWSQSTSYRTTFLRSDVFPDFTEVFGKEYVHEKYLKTVVSASLLPGETPLEKRMKEMILLNAKWFMQTLLDRKDRMSMFSSLEVRVPFCDHRIAQYLYNVPWDFKDYMGREKGMLREAMKGLLPEEILWRKKSPYPKTHHPEYLKHVSELLIDIIDDPSAPIHDIVDKTALTKLLDSKSEIPWYGQLMTKPQTIAYLIQINYWLKKYGITIV